MQYVNALSPPIAGERVGVEGWGGNGHLLEAYNVADLQLNAVGGYADLVEKV